MFWVDVRLLTRIEAWVEVEVGLRILLLHVVAVLPKKHLRFVRHEVVAGFRSPLEAERLGVVISVVVEQCALVSATCLG